VTAARHGVATRGAACRSPGTSTTTPSACTRPAT